MRVDYIYDDHDYDSFDEIEKRYYDNVIIWVVGSLRYGDDFASYYVLMQYKEHKDFMYGRVIDATPNQAALVGVKKALEKMNKPMTVCVVDTTLLGFKGALRGKGVNCEYALSVFDVLLEKRCRMIEVCWRKLSPKLKPYILKNDIEDVSKRYDILTNIDEGKRNYRDKIYCECISKVEDILKKNNVDKKIIDQVLQLKGL